MRRVGVRAIEDGHIGPFQLDHLSRFYLLLVCVSISSVFGSIYGEYIGSFFSLFGGLVSFGCFHRIAIRHERTRSFLLCLVVFCQWAFVNHWFARFSPVDSGFVVSLLSAVTVVFSCYWVAARISTRIFTEHIAWVYFVAFFLCTILVMLWLQICSWVFGGDSARLKYQLYLFILWFMGYVATHSHVVIGRTRGGDTDYVIHAHSLFIDSPRVVIQFIQLLNPIWDRYVAHDPDD